MLLLHGAAFFAGAPGGRTFQRVQVPNPPGSGKDTGCLLMITRVGGEGADLPTDVSTVTYTDNSGEYKFPLSVCRINGRKGGTKRSRPSCRNRWY